MPPNKAENNWSVSPKEAIEIQKKLKDEVSTVPNRKKIRTIAGADVSLNMFEKDIFAGIIVMSFPELVPIEHAVVKMRADFPYIPGLLSFREVPALLECFKQLKNKPDLIMVDGQGIAHPRHLGIASHLGVILDAPTIGCAKSRLFGKYKEPKNPGDKEPILDPKTNEKIGFALKSKKRSNSILISPGNLVSTDQALNIVERCLKGYKLPEPTRQAHILVNKFRKGEALQEYEK
jgi:deoxyribonuclease V